MHKTLKSIPLEWLQAGRYQPRRHFPERALQELAKSIAQQGIIEPLVVRELNKDQYEIIAGERRWRAAMLAGLAELPCLLGDYSNEQAATISLIENIQRQDLNLLEEAQGYQRLVTDFHFQQDEVACLVGKSRSHIANILRLLSLCEKVQERIRNGELSLGHARMLVGLSPAQQLSLAEQVHTQEWSVRALEKHLRSNKSDPLKNAKSSRDVQHLESKIAEQIGAPVQILNENGSEGWLKIKFFDNDTLAGLLDRMGLSYD